MPLATHFPTSQAPDRPRPRLTPPIHSQHQGLLSCPAGQACPLFLDNSPPWLPITLG